MAIFRDLCACLSADRPGLCVSLSAPQPRQAGAQTGQILILKIRRCIQSG